MFIGNSLAMGTLIMDNPIGVAGNNRFPDLEPLSQQEAEKSSIYASVVSN